MTIVTGLSPGKFNNPQTNVQSSRWSLLSAPPPPPGVVKFSPVHTSLVDWSDLCKLLPSAFTGLVFVMPCTPPATEQELPIWGFYTNRQLRLIELGGKKTLSTTGRLIFCFWKVSLMDSFIVKQLEVGWWGLMQFLPHFLSNVTMLACLVLLRKTMRSSLMVIERSCGAILVANVCIGNCNLHSHDICPTLCLNPFLFFLLFWRQLLWNAFLLSA